MSKTPVEMMQEEIDDTKDWLRLIINAARMCDVGVLVGVTDAADNWLHRDELAAEYGPEVAACQDALDTAALGWAGAGAEASDDDALAQMREAGR